MSSRILKLCLLYLTLTTLGCGPGVGQISGTVTVAGKPVPAGLVTFLPDDPAANAISAELDRQGQFQIELPVGTCRIAIDNRQYEPLPKAGVGVPTGIVLSADVMAKLKQTPAANAEPMEVDASKTTDAPIAREAGMYVKLPDKFYQIETSGLTIQVEGGAQTVNIDL